MVVLLVGILAIVRIFPPGFASVRRSEAVTLAGRLAQQEMERWTANSENLPEGIVPIGTDGTILSHQYPGPPIDNDNAVSIRRIIGETTRIPFGGWSSTPGNGSTYMLAFAPINTSTAIAVRGGNLTRRVIDSSATDGTQPWDYLSPFQYGIDYEDKKIVFPVSGQARDYWLSVSWIEHEGSAENYRSATNILISVPGGTAVWLPILVPVTTGVTDWELDDGSDTVCRGFINIGSNSWSSDPYEYKLLNDILGVISFNPNGYVQKEFGRPLEARIDYDILDLGIIHEDRVVPVSAPYQIRTTLKMLREKDYDDWLGISLDGGATHLDVIVVDLETGLYVTNVTFNDIDYKAGVIDLQDNIDLYGGVSVPSAGRNLRVLYKTVLDWSLQFQKAYNVYSRVYANSDGTMLLDYRSYAIHSGNPDRLWFSACNSNNTISVTYEWDDSGTTKKVVGECNRTGELRDLSNPWPPGTVKYTYITLKHVPTRIFTVNGVSVRARALWRDTDRWRNVDLDTTLLRKAASY